MSQLIKCLYCPQSTTFYRFAKQLEAHIAAEHLNLFQYKCQLCKFMWLPTEYALMKHYSDVHEIVSGIPFNACKESNCETDKLNELEEKLKRCIEVSQVLDNRNKSQLELTPCDSVKCQDCSLQFNNKEWLEAHIASVHLHSMPYRCELCENACFPTKYTLKRHYNHDGTSNFEITFNFSPKVVKEREELAKKVELCMSKRKIGIGMGSTAPQPSPPVTTEANIPGPQPENVTTESSEIPTRPDYSGPTTTPVSQSDSMRHQQNGHTNVKTGATTNVRGPELAPLVPPGFTDRCLLPCTSNLPEFQTEYSGIPSLPTGPYYVGPLNTSVYQDDTMQYQHYPNGYQTENPMIAMEQQFSSMHPYAQQESLPTEPYYVRPTNAPVYQDSSMQYQQNVYPTVPMMPMEQPAPPTYQYDQSRLRPGVYSVVGPLCPPGFQDVPMQYQGTTGANVPVYLPEIQATLTLVNPVE
ncbi:unnamed protein product [Caenorhabditis brenneri]